MVYCLCITAEYELIGQKGMAGGGRRFWPEQPMPLSQSAHWLPGWKGDFAFSPAEYYRDLRIAFGGSSIRCPGPVN
jgi:hypothetical protein